MALRCELCLRAVTDREACPEHPYADLLDPQDPEDRQLITLRREMSLESQTALALTIAAFIILVPTGVFFALLDPIAATVYAVLSSIVILPLIMVSVFARRLWQRWWS